MKTVLRWQKGLLDSTYKIYAGDILVGFLDIRSFSSRTEAALNGKKYDFIASGIFKKTVTIIDKENHAVIGSITYNTWTTKATINFSGKSFTWKATNFTGSKWRVIGTDDFLEVQNGFSRGIINFDEQDPLVPLTGLYAFNYYVQVIFVILLTLFVIFVMK